MITVKRCILDKIKASNPCTLSSLRYEVVTQQTEMLSGNRFCLEKAICIGLEDLIKEGEISIGICDNDVVFDFPR